MFMDLGRRWLVCAAEVSIRGKEKSGLGSISMVGAAGAMLPMLFEYAWGLGTTTWAMLSSAVSIVPIMSRPSGCTAEGRPSSTTASNVPPVEEPAGKSIPETRGDAMGTVRAGREREKDALVNEQRAVVAEEGVWACSVGVAHSSQSVVRHRRSWAGGSVVDGGRKNSTK